jgi:hypothetical protein
MKLMVATEFSPNASGGGPAVVRQMIRGWPVDDLFWWSCFPDPTPRFGRKVHQLFCAKIPAKLYPHNRFVFWKSLLLENIWVPWASRHLKNTLRRLKPDAIWVIPHDWSIPPVTRALRDGVLPYHVTVQDYVDVHNNPRRFGRERCRRMAAMADQLYARSRTRDATSHPMIEDLQARTGQKAAQMLHAGLESADFAFLEKKVSRKTNGIRIGYAGTILVEEVFELFVSAIRKLRSALPRPVEIHLFGSHSYASRPWFDPGWMVEHGNLTEPDLLARLRECDWGFSPMALTDEDPRYNRYSFPTKFITYLAAGLPIITLGHSQSSIMRMAAGYEVGPHTATRDADLLAGELSPALMLQSPWVQYGKEIVRCARGEFDAERMRRKLYQCFTEGVSPPPGEGLARNRDAMR